MHLFSHSQLADHTFCVSENSERFEFYLNVLNLIQLNASVQSSVQIIKPAL